MPEMDTAKLNNGFPWSLMGLLQQMGVFIFQCCEVFLYCSWKCVVDPNFSVL